MLSELLKDFNKLDEDLLIGKMTYKNLAYLLTNGRIIVELNENRKTTKTTIEDKTIEYPLINKDTINEIAKLMLNGEYIGCHLVFRVSGCERLSVVDGLHQLLSIYQVANKLPNKTIDVLISNNIVR